MIIYKKIFLILFLNCVFIVSINIKALELSSDEEKLEPWIPSISASFNHSKTALKTIIILNKIPEFETCEFKDLSLAKPTISTDGILTFKILDENGNYSFENHYIFMENKKDEPLFTKIPSATDIVQSGIGDCYFLTALGIIARHSPNIILNNIRDNKDGTVSVRLYDEECTPIDYIISKSTAKNVGAVNSLWVKLYEKAYVLHTEKFLCKKMQSINPEKFKKFSFPLKSHNFDLITGAFRTHEAMSHICGGTEHGVLEKIDSKNNHHLLIPKSEINEHNVGVYSEGAKLFFDYEICQKLSNKYILSATTRGIPMSAENGILSSHAYGIIDVFREKETVTGKLLNLIILRNPHGENIPHYIKDKSGKYLLESCKESKDGIFILDLNDFLDIFTTLHYCKLP